MRKGQIKKRIYKFVGTKKIDMNSIYTKFRYVMLDCVSKFHIFEGHPMSIFNSPIYLTAQQYIKYGDKILKDLDSLHFILYNCCYYKNNDEKFKKEMIRRLIKNIKSIKKYGYAEGSFKNRLCGVCIGVNPYFGVVKGYELISGKHRIAACAALGYTNIVCSVFKKIGAK